VYPKREREKCEYSDGMPNAVQKRGGEREKKTMLG
jgi:hypothetical protein